MVQKLFRNKSTEATLLDPGCGDGVFIEAVLDWCKVKGTKPPRILGVELDPELASICRRKFERRQEVSIVQGDFLSGDFGQFDFIICNPPYARLEELSEEERSFYRRIYEVAVGRFDLYMLFFEKAIKVLKGGGRAVFITPEKFEYTLSTAPLRRLMARYHVEELHHLREDAFRGLITYPAITTLNKVEGQGKSTRIIARDGLTFFVRLPRDGSRWIPIIIRGGTQEEGEGPTLRDVARRISCGVATGEDKVFVLPKDEVPKALSGIAYPTVGGKDLTPEGIRIMHKMIIPYDEEGHLLPPDELEEFIKWAERSRRKLEDRYCVRKGKRKWYEFHERPPMKEILRPKILCKDIAEEPSFWLDEEGKIVPRHSVYYIVPKNPSLLRKLYEYLNSEESKRWIMAHAQRAANDFIRLQSKVLARLPMPQELQGD